MDNKELVIASIVAGLFIVIFSYYALRSNVMEKPKPRSVGEVPLSEFQIKACNAADRGGFCKTRLPKLKLVSDADCCRYLNKCCQQ